MSSSCIEEVSVPDDNWYRIANELLSRAGIAINGSAPADIRVKNPDFFKRVLQEGSLGLGESYMDGWWECDRLDMFFSKVLRAGLENQLPHHFKDTLRIAGARLFNLQSKKRAWIVGKEHYDLGNDLFSRMLDPFMQYSCAYWKDADNLESAQQAKLKMICEKLQLKPGMRVLDIGCGWGGLAHYMASNYDVSVVGVDDSLDDFVAHNELTTVRFDLHQRGREVFEHAVPEAGTAGKTVAIRIPGQLIIRHSTAIPRS